MIPQLLSDPYLTLQIDDSSTPQQIRERYLMLSKTFHPDKQSSQNYHLAKQYFMKIDEAYKSVSTPLRQHIYSQFGMAGIELLEEHLLEFSEFQSTIQQERTQQEVEELILYYHMQVEDPNEQLTKTQSLGYVDVTGVYDGRRHLVAHANRYPKLVSNKVVFASTIPELAEFQNTAEVSVELTYQKNTRTNFKIYSNRRFWQGILKGVVISNQLMLQQQGISQRLLFSIALSPNTTLILTPFIFQSNSLSSPQIGLQRTFSNDISLSATAGLGAFSFQLNQYKQGLSKFLTMQFGPSTLETQFGVQKKISQDCQLVCGVNVNTMYFKNSFELSFGYHYGIKLEFEESRLEIRSFLGEHNYLDFRIQKGKSFMRLPVFIEADLLAWEASKFAVIILAYASHRLLKMRRRRQMKQRARMMKKNFGHLAENRSKVNKLNDEVREQGRTSANFQIRANGLVILKALYGSSQQIAKLAKIYGREKLNNAVPLGEELCRLHDIHSDSFTTHEEEVYDVTIFVQSHVTGSRLKDFKAVLPNPCIDQRERPVLLLWYYYRGKLFLIKSHLRHAINIGLGPKPVNNVISRLLTWFTVNFS